MAKTSNKSPEQKLRVVLSVLRGELKARGWSRIEFAADARPSSTDRGRDLRRRSPDHVRPCAVDRRCSWDGCTTLAQLAGVSALTLRIGPAQRRNRITSGQRIRGVGHGLAPLSTT